LTARAASWCSRRSRLPGFSGAGGGGRDRLGPRSRRVRGTIVFTGSFQGVTQTMPLAIYGTLERDFDAAVALSVLVLGFSFAVILPARFFTRRTEGHTGQD
jgi:hypothetical protein